MEQTESSDRWQKTTKTRRENAGTNDNSIVSKCSMSAAGYFQDPFLKEFVAKISKRAPLINRGYYMRAVCIDQVLKQFLAKNQGCRKQIVSLGAGFDSAYFRLKSQGLLHDAAFYEIDFPEVTKRKHAIIESKSELYRFLTSDEQNKKVVPPIELWTSDYCLLGIDLTQLNTLEAALRLCGADFDCPTLLMSECVMTYMTRRCSSALVKWGGETFQDAVFVMYEQINPDDAFGQFMQNHFNTVGSPLKCINAFPTVESQMKRFLELGWQKVKCHDLNVLYRHTLVAEERGRIETLDPFDEYEEFNLKCAHYFLLVATTESSVSDYLGHMPALAGSDDPPQPLRDLTTVAIVPTVGLSVKRFSHSSVLMANRYILTAGGFGEVDGRHQRVQEVSLTDTVTMETRLIRCHSEDNELQYSRMHHSAVVLSDGRMLLLGGRQSPFFLCTQLLLFDLRPNADLQDDLDPSNSEGQGHRHSPTADGGMNGSGTEKTGCSPCEERGGVRNAGGRDCAEGRNSCGCSPAESGATTGDSSVCDNNLNVSENSMSASSKHNCGGSNRRGSNRGPEGQGDNSENWSEEAASNSSNHLSGGSNRTGSNRGVEGLPNSSQNIPEGSNRNCSYRGFEGLTISSQNLPEGSNRTSSNRGFEGLTTSSQNLPEDSNRTSSNQELPMSSQNLPEGSNRNGSNQGVPTSSQNLPEGSNRNGSSHGQEGQSFGGHQVCAAEGEEERTNFAGGHVTCTVLNQSGDVPCSRWRHACALVTLDGGDCVFLHGGRTQEAEVLADTYMLDVSSGTWTKLECSGEGPGALHSHCMVRWGEGVAQRVVLVGGVDWDQRPQTSVFILDPNSLVWQRLQVTGTFVPRFSHTCHVIDDRLVMVGGVNLNRRTPGVGILNLRTGVAQEFSFPSMPKQQLLMYHRHSSVLLLDGRIVVLGGGGNCFSFGTHLNQTPVTLDISRCLEAMA